MSPELVPSGKAATTAATAGHSSAFDAPHGSAIEGVADLLPTPPPTPPPRTGHRAGALSPSSSTSNASTAIRDRATRWLHALWEATSDEERDREGQKASEIDEMGRGSHLLSGDSADSRGAKQSKSSHPSTRLSSQQLLAQLPISLTPAGAAALTSASQEASQDAAAAADEALRVSKLALRSVDEVAEAMRELEQ